MDGEKFDFPSEQFSPCLDMSSCSFDIDDFLGPTPACNEALGWTEACADGFGRTQACAHAHACHPSGPDKSHTHTCIHVHTQIMPTSSDVQAPSSDNAEWVDKAQKFPSGNREAVRKYREKKKARISFLEDEVVRLRDLNQQLMKRLQVQDSLEAEIARLKCLLVDIRGRIEGEIGSFPYRKTTRNQDIIPNTNIFSTNMMAPCKMQCNDHNNCLGPGPKMDVLNSKDLDGCVSDSLQSSGTHNSGQNMVSKLGFGNVDGVSISNASTNKRRRGARNAKAS
ncbi:basic leucine zipper 23-like [Primulina huaijiensis]|uniref:basic leucine zipper 23-like n=1 Tax=Primulina huaijiensis TaxID=1492673 RepID=UPI003CC74527